MRKGYSTTIDFIVIISIILFAWPIVYSSVSAMQKPEFTPSFGLIFQYCLAWFVFLLYPILVIIFNHMGRDGSGLLINLISIALLTYVIYKSIYMAFTEVDMFVSIPLFIILFGITPILVLIFNNKPHR